MASIRNLKKDVNYLVEVVCSDCYAATIFNENIDTDKVAAIISDALVLRQDMINRINHPKVEKNDRKAVRKYYKGLQNEIIEKVDQMFSDLSATIK